MAAREAIVLTVSATQPFVSCPGCKSTVSLRDVGQLDGAKMLCVRCGAKWTLKVAPPASR